MWDFKGRHIVNLLQQESEFWACDRRNLLPNLYVWVHALLWVAEHVRVHTWRTYMAVEAAGCPLFLGHHKIPLGQDLFLNLWLVFFKLGWKPTSPNHPPVSAHLGAGSQACLGHLARYTGAGNNCKPHNYTFSDLHQGIPPVHFLNIFFHILSIFNL